MNSKKLVIAMVGIITTLLFCVIIISVLNMAGVDLLKIGKNNSEVSQNEVKIATINLEDDGSTIEEKVLQQKVEEIQNMEFSKERSNVITDFIETSRSGNIDRRELYVELEESNKQLDYEEVKTYIPLSELTISFTMDVSKPTGLSKEDFISLVQKMKYDKTGILKANAGVIWENCQKYNVNEIFVLGICGIESAWCSAPQHQNTHNYASLMSKGRLIPYATDEQGFEALIKLLGQSYLRPGAGLYHGSTITGVGTCFCNTTTWPPKVFKCMQQALQ